MSGSASNEGLTAWKILRAGQNTGMQENYLKNRPTEDKVQKLNPEKNRGNSEANFIT